MDDSETKPVAVVAGVGPGLGTALCRRLAEAGYAVAGLARSADYVEGLAADIRDGGGEMTGYECDTTVDYGVDLTFTEIEQALGVPRVLIYNPGRFLRGGLLETEPGDFTEAWRVNCLGAFLCARRVAPGMLVSGGGCMLFSGATASVKAGGSFAAFGSSKFALRGLAQSLARELGPRGIHVAHVVIDGIVWTPRTSQWPDVSKESCLQPEAIAETCLQLIRQERSAWTFELELRPDVEPF